MSGQIIRTRQTDESALQAGVGIVYIVTFFTRLNTGYDRTEEVHTMSTKEIQEQIVDNMQRWQKVENASVASTGKVMEKTRNPVVRLVMEVIQRDSQMHYRIQELIADSLQTKTIELNPDELADVWDMIEHHIELEKKTVKLAYEALESLKGKKMVVQEYLIRYLLEDEEKHNSLLEKLETIKKGMYPYG